MQDLKSEKNWHEQKFYVDSGHWTSLPIFASRERHWLKNDQMKIRFYGYLYKYLKKQNYGDNPSILFAPIGDGDDFKYVNTLSKKYLALIYLRLHCKNVQDVFLLLRLIF